MSSSKRKGATRSGSGEFAGNSANRNDRDGRTELRTSGNKSSKPNPTTPPVTPRKTDSPPPSNSSGNSSTHSLHTPIPESTLTLAQSNKLMYDRTLWVVMNLVGKNVEAQVRTGEIYEGILHTACTEKGLGVVLKMAKRKEQNAEKKSQPRPIDTYVIYPADLVQIYAKDVSFEISKAEFQTDTDISTGFGRRERELQPWMPDPATPSSVDLALDGNSDWDQFEVNKTLFGVDTTYSDDFYTTSLDRSAAAYRERAQEANRIAQEIEGKVSSNIHVLEERGLRIENEMDEEERYSTVIRDAPGKYIPPQKRGLISKKDLSKEDREKYAKESKRDPEDREPLEHYPLERTDSLEDLEQSKGGSSRGSPSRSPSMSPKDIPFAAERLRLRLSIVNERYKNKTPVADKENEQGFSSPHRSPLLSPLVGNARNVNALSLEPSTPKIDEDVVKEFFDFSLNAKKEGSARNSFITDLKSFSKSLEKKITPKTPTPQGESSDKSELPTATTASSTVSPAKTTVAASVTPTKSSSSTPSTVSPVKVEATTTPSPAKPSTSSTAATPASVVSPTKAPTTATPSSAAPTKQVTTTQAATSAKPTPSTAPSKVDTPTKTEPKPEAKPEPKPEVKAEAKSETKTEAKSEVKTDTKTEVKSEPKADNKSDSKTDGKDAKSEAKQEEEGKSSKLNPNARVFKPMSANAPSFTPSMPAPYQVPTMMDHGEDWGVYGRGYQEEPFGYPGYQLGGRPPVFPVPYMAPQQLIPNQPYPPPVRVVPQGPPYAFGSIPPIIYPQPQATPQVTPNPAAKRFVPGAVPIPTGPKPGQAAPQYPPFSGMMPPGRVVIPQQPYGYGRPGIAMVPPTMEFGRNPMQPVFYPPPHEGNFHDKEDTKFQAPSNDTQQNPKQ